MINETIINGTFITPPTFEFLVEKIKEQKNLALLEPCPTEVILSTCQHFADHLKKNQIWLENLGTIYGLSPNETSLLAKELNLFCQRAYLEAKLVREFKTITPFTIRRPNLKENIFEGWQPLGTILHITPGNALSLPFIAVIEGLLSGNFNILRPSHKDGGLSAALLHHLIHLDSSCTLAKYVLVLTASRDQLPNLMTLVDGVSAWGGDASLNILRAQVPSGCRFIEWGHKLSFAYLDETVHEEKWFNAIAKDVCQFDQQFCSSPQMLMVNTSNWERLLEVGSAMAQAMSVISNKYPALQPSPQEMAEITTQVHLAELESAHGEQKIKIWEDQNQNWRIILTDKPGPHSSPLFRTLLISPTTSELLVSTLQPFRRWLQTCALIARPNRYSDLAQTLLAAGVSRITAPGAMHSEYPGEPHDGVYALTQLTRRVSINPKEIWPNTRASINTVQFRPAKKWLKLPVIKKSDFISKGYNHVHSDLFFLTGGTSGKPKLSTFSYSDFHLQMQTAADGLLAAGLNPSEDRIMNLLYAGKLYGSFLSFSTIFDKLGIPHFPMGFPTIHDLPFVAKILIEHKINALFGLPSVLFLLFSQQKELLNEYRGIKKIFYGGEFLGHGQRQIFEEMGVELVQSAIYASLDAGVSGYACSHCPEGTFHLITQTQWLEILQIDNDIPVKGNEIGRLIFSSNRQSQPLQRYELGDIGRWVSNHCPCGSAEPKFELLGRLGDTIKIGGTPPTDCKSIQAFIEQRSGYQDALQIRLDYNTNHQERLSLRFSGEPKLTSTQLKEAILSHFPHFDRAVCDQRLNVQIEYNTPITQNPHSGKFPLVIDLRNSLVHATL